MDRIEKAFQQIDRANFVSPDLVTRASVDTALPIGYGQTISQPSTVRQMLYWLDPQPADRVLDVGSGSCWTTALLAYIVGNKGRVYAVERIPELMDFGQANCQRLGLGNIEFHLASDGIYGLPQLGPFDRILVSASATNIPAQLLGQMKVGGKMIIPVGNSILEIAQTALDKYDITSHPGFVFVPLV